MPVLLTEGASFIYLPVSKRIEGLVMNILISGASVAGPVLAYWLRRYGFSPVVVERAPLLRAGTGGHAVDLFEPAVRIAEYMGIHSEVEAMHTRTSALTLERPGRGPVHVDFSRFATHDSGDDHIEIIRGELARILHEATRDDVEYLFGDTITGISEDSGGVDVTFARNKPRRFDLVVGADGLHSGVRGLVFGPESGYRNFLGGYLSAFTVPGHGMPEGRMSVYHAVDKLVATYPVWQTGEARAVFLFRRREELAYDHRDTARQVELLREVFAGEGSQVPRLLAEAAGADDFYLDSISQILMDTWSKGRVTLVGDAGYSPGPAVGGGTTVAMVGAYLLAANLAKARGDHTVAFARYEKDMSDYVATTRTVGPKVMKTIVPRSRFEAALTATVLRWLPRVPKPLLRMALNSPNRPSRSLAGIRISPPEPVPG
ncbi:hypothetical protein BAY61_11690 [Prauserella marina]|uniref:2-polyprenyl-6-methoxyphenol hydroxylase n=2 Tax=Prauserella marina TaxID=530584 RepID=A0A222VNQ6_9PSEU|nr:hypothetical protein BAY61_11690 [Prauserella marina]PWV84609.1 2-polyprenyl-6-methoxyphenol hydroxylase-like FAD-dependent oxidoreductase [Prauserella marina]SDC17806.1 2-polyprenyl-6-methoxyphenol hydroxylase [Prauserella marina]